MATNLPGDPMEVAVATGLTQKQPADRLAISEHKRLNFEGHRAGLCLQATGGTDHEVK